MTNFQIAIQFVLEKEGGYVNDPKDPGGETNYGISKRYHPNVDIKNLTLDTAMRIYYNEYWVVNRCDSYSLGLGICILDTAVNQGIGTLRKLLDQMTSDDFQELISLRRQEYLRLIQKKPELIRFKRGWMNRLNDLSKYCEITLQNQI
jgi:hypothetical protein